MSILPFFMQSSGVLLKVFKKSDFQIQKVTFCLWAGICGHLLLILGGVEQTVQHLAPKQ